MKKFLNHIFIFVLATGAMYAAMSFVNKVVVNKNLSRDYQNVETLILGDSRAHWINEKIIPNSLNLFQGGDTYKASYYKLLKIHELNPELSNVVVIVDAHNLNGLYEWRISDEKESIKRIHQLTSVTEMMKSTSNYKALIELLSRYNFTFSFGQVFDSKKKYTFDDLVLYRDLEKSTEFYEQNLGTKKDYSHIKSIDSAGVVKRIKGAEWFYYRKYSDYHGTLALKYLGQILEYNKAHGIKSTIVSMPIDPDMYKKISQRKIKHFHQKIDSLSELFDFKYMNLRGEFDTRLDLLENPDHVNPHGGALISIQLNDVIDENK